MCRDSNGGVIEHRQQRRSLAFTQNNLQEQYFVEELTSPQFRPIPESGFFGAGLILIASRVFWGRMVFSDNGWTAAAGGYNADRHTGVVCRVVPWQSAR
jgi:hypothetical protein